MFINLLFAFLAIVNISRAEEVEISPRILKLYAARPDLFPPTASMLQKLEKVAKKFGLLLAKNSDHNEPIHNKPIDKLTENNSKTESDKTAELVDLKSLKEAIKAEEIAKQKELISELENPKSDTTENTETNPKSDVVDNKQDQSDSSDSGEISTDQINTL